VRRLLIALFLLLGTAAQAQTRVPRLGFLVQEMGRAQSQAIKGVSAELKQLGYQERKSFSLVPRNAKGDRSALQASAKELADKKVEVIFTTGTRATMAAISASQDVPIVFVHPGDPAAVGIMKGGADSPRNVTGVAAYAAETTEKRLALFKEILPSLTKIHVFFDANSSFSRNNFALAESAAKKLGVQIIGHGVKSTDELKTTLGNLNNEPGVAIFQVTDDLVESEAEYFFATARQKKMPTVFNEEVWAINGATVAYGPSYLDMGRLAAHSIAEIFKGKAPTALPIVRASKFDLTINYRAAKFIDLVLPNNILKKADKVIR